MGKKPKTRGDLNWIPPTPMRGDARWTTNDRIFGVWLRGVELLRSCTTEPMQNVIVWSVKKDITSIHFYPTEKNLNYNYEQNLGNLDFGYHYWADLILSISRNLPLNDDALWAVLEVYVSFHENDEFWYSNALNEYITANNLRGTPGNGSFREVTSTKTKGELSKHSSLPLVVSLVLDFKGLNGTFLTRVGRYVSSTGWVKSSYGNITTDTIQDLYNSNTMVIGVRNKLTHKIKPSF
ncbi:hypothetical protein ACFX1Q_040365 [Malus domestica]